MAHDVSRRLKAARMLGGYSSPAKLAAAIGREKFGARTIRSIEEGDRPLEDYEAAWVATACQIDAAFFTVDLEDLPQPEAPSVTRAAEASEVELLEAALALARARERDEPWPDGQGRQGQGGAGPR